jgi:hypothetical protein
MVWTGTDFFVLGDPMIASARIGKVAKLDSSQSYGKPREESGALRTWKLIIEVRETPYGRRVGFRYSAS